MPVWVAIAPLMGSTTGEGRAGIYWTVSENNPITAPMYNFGKGSQALYRRPGPEADGRFRALRQEVESLDTSGPRNPIVVERARR